MTDLSHHLANRFSHTESGIMISVDHSQCLMFGKSFEPTYILTITTVPSELRAETNKLNALYIQDFMSDLLSVPPDRGVLRFEAIPEENLAINGMTVLGAIERIQSMRTVPRRLSAQSLSVSNGNGVNGVSHDTALNKGSPRRLSKRATERISNPLHLSRITIPERANSVRSTVSSISTTDMPPSPQLQPSRPGSSSLQKQPSSTPLADLVRRRSNDSRSSIQTLPGPSYETMSNLLTQPAYAMERKPSQTRNNRESVRDTDGRRDTVMHQDHHATALPPPPIPRDPVPTPVEAAAKRKRKSIMSVFRRK